MNKKINKDSSFSIMILICMLLSACCKKRDEVYHVAFKFRNIETVIMEDSLPPPPPPVKILYICKDNFILDKNHSVYYYHHDKITFYSFGDTIPVLNLKTSDFKLIPKDTLSVAFLERLNLLKEDGSCGFVVISESDSIRNKSFKIFMNFFNKKKVKSCTIRATSEEENRILDTLSKKVK